MLARRARILEVARIPDPYDERGDDAGSDVLTLVHSMSHRLIRRIASIAGIERDAIAEYLVPEHLSFVLYAATRGDFVLGGMHRPSLNTNSISRWTRPPTANRAAR
jgi:hypothetical protein